MGDTLQDDTGITKTTIADTVERLFGEEPPTDEFDVNRLPPLRAYNVVATFDGSGAARDALVRLERQDYGEEALSFLALEPEPHDQPADVREADNETISELGGDAAKGAATGGVIAAAGAGAAMLLPGIGTVVGVGALLGATAFGGALGGFVNVFAHTAANEQWEDTFAALRAGRSVIAVHTDDLDEARRAEEVLLETEPVEVWIVDDEGQPLTASWQLQPEEPEESGRTGQTEPSDTPHAAHATTQTYATTQEDQTMPSEDHEQEETEALHSTEERIEELADRAPTPEEDRAAEETELPDETREAYEEMAERGAHQKGEGRIYPEGED